VQMGQASTDLSHTRSNSSSKHTNASKTRAATAPAKVRAKCKFKCQQKVVRTRTGTVLHDFHFRHIPWAKIPFAMAETEKTGKQTDKKTDDVWEPPVPVTLRLSWLLIYLQVVRTLKMPFESRQVSACQAQVIVPDMNN
jgi:hypothetical protein